MQIEVRGMTPDDWPAVREIYRQGIDSGDATFEREPPDWEAWHARRPSEPDPPATERSGRDAYRVARREFDELADLRHVLAYESNRVAVDAIYVG